MKKSDLIGRNKPFASQARLAAALGISQPAISKWDEVPLLRQYQIMDMPEYKRWRRRKR